MDHAAQEEIQEIMQILPESLSLQLQTFLHRELIATVPFLQNRDVKFYIAILDKLKPMRFD